MPAAIQFSQWSFKNVDTAQERISLAYFKSATWQKITVDRAVCANANKIVHVSVRSGLR